MSAHPARGNKDMMNQISFAKLVADWVVFLADGKAAESSAAVDFFLQPQSALAQQYLEGLSKYR